MDPSDIPLRDIHLPEAIGFLPLASGLATLLVLAGLSLLGVVFVHFLRKGRYRRAAFRELKLLEVDYKQSANASELVRGLSTLLRRAALLKHPRDQFASIHGEQWLEFLDGDHPEKPFSRGVGEILQDGPYRKNLNDLDAKDFEQLLSACRIRLSGLLS
ncbi:MAG: DUF4381 domain-containing protein [Pseudomonadota bacterium]